MTWKIKTQTIYKCISIYVMFLQFSWWYLAIIINIIYPFLCLIHIFYGNLKCSFQCTLLFSNYEALINASSSVHNSIAQKFRYNVFGSSAQGLENEDVSQSAFSCETWSPLLGSHSYGRIQFCSSNMRFVNHKLVLAVVACLLSLQGLIHVLLQLLTSNTPWRSWGWRAEMRLCAPGNWQDRPLLWL